MEHVILNVTMQHVWDNQRIGPSHHRLIKGRCCLTNLISCDKVTHLMDDGKALDVSAWAVVKPFDTISSRRNWLLMVCTGALFTGQKAVWMDNGVTPAGGWSQMLFPRAQC